jgi:hypothetical protein
MVIFQIAMLVYQRVIDALTTNVSGELNQPTSHVTCRILGVEIRPLASAASVTVDFITRVTKSTSSLKTKTHRV